MAGFHYILGLCFLLTGTVTGFLLQRPNTNHTTEEWSEWKVLQEYPICFLVRTRPCVSVNCTEGEKEYRYCKDIASWGEWGPLQCTIKTNTCFIVRKRNCSVQTLPDCYSNEPDTDLTVLGDFKSCPCAEGTTTSILIQKPDNIQTSEEWSDWSVLQENPTCLLLRTRACVSGGCNWTTEYRYCQEIASWGEWGPLQCTLKYNTCFIVRRRNCSVQDLSDCLSNEDNSDVTVWGDFKTCPCAEDSSSNKNDTQSINGTLSSASWLEWGSWECHRVDIGCLLIRNRHCSSKETECIGNSYQLDSCKADTCGTTNGTAVDSTWSPWKCHNELRPCVMYRHRMCTFQSGFAGNCSTEHYEMKSCDETCTGLTTSVGASGTNLLSTVMSYITAVTSAVFTPSVYSVSTSPTSTGLVSSTSPSLDSTSVGLTSHLGITSSSTPPASASSALTTLPSVMVSSVAPCIQSVCTAWEEWGKWRCRLGNNGTCTMSRSRECSTASPGECWKDALMTRSCDPSVCPEKVKLEQRCHGYVSDGRPCVDASTCNIIDNPFHPICELGHMSHDICPKACGCCEELPYWLEWSPWKCYLAPNHTCEMHRTRNCSTSSLDDCMGKSAETASCSHSVCPDALIASKRVDCSLFDNSATKCIEHKGCMEFKIDLALDVVCLEPKLAADCPVTCGCCTNSTTVTPVEQVLWSPWECHFDQTPCMMNRHRICKSTSDSGIPCSNKHYEMKACDKSCTVLPYWLEWSSWRCVLAPNHTCEMHRTRNCSTGTPDDCIGKSVEKTSCSNTVCPAIISLSTKVDCSAVDRNCVDGPGCSGFREKSLLDLLCTNPTTVAECPITCGCCGLPHWLEWSAWECYETQNRTCEMRRYRNCSTGPLDDCVGMSTMITNCPDTICPVNGEWAVWQEWSTCSHSCSRGTRTRVRTCTNPAPSHGGQDCAGNKTDTETCNNAKCPEWSQWFYGACSVTCGNGTVMRLRHCSSGKDSDCGTGNAFESTTCSEIPCI